MAFSLVQFNAATGSSANPACTYDSTPTSGNLLVAWVCGALNSTISATPSGWNNLTRSGGGSGGSSRFGFLSWKISAGTESGSQQWTVSGSNSWTCFLAEFSGNHATPLDVENSQLNASGVENTPTVAASAGERLAIIAAELQANSAGQFSGWAITGGHTTTEIEELAAASVIGGGWAYAVIPSASGSYQGTYTTANFVGIGAIALFKGAGAAAATRYRAII
jgi:hypothetical protein